MAKEAIVRSAAITDGELPNPAEYDEELMEARLVEQGSRLDVPSTDLDDVEQAGVQPIAKTTGNMSPDPTGGEGDLQAAMGETVTGDPDNPDAVDDSKVPEGYGPGDADEAEVEGLNDAARGMDEAIGDTPIDRSVAVQGSDEEE